MLQNPYIKALYSPSSIVVIGDSLSQGESGHTVLQNLVAANFTGKIFSVNSEGKSILGIQSFCKLEDIQEQTTPIDLAVLCLSTAEVEYYLTPLEKIGVKFAIIISSWQKETWSEKTRNALHLKTLAVKHGITLIGPNSMGVAFPHSSVNLFATQRNFKKGVIGFFSQSSSMCDGMSDWAERNGYGFSSFLSLGSKSMVDEATAITAMAEDPHTKVILGFLENVEQGEKFLHAAQNATHKKPVILMKTAKSNAGVRASGSHKGSVAGSAMAYEAAFKQAGIIPADKIEDLFTFAQAFSTQPLPMGSGVGVVTMAGGPGVVVADACAATGLTISMLSPTSLQELEKMLHGDASLFNPVNLGADVQEEILMAVLGIVIKDPAVNSLLFVGSRTAKAKLEKTAAFLAHQGSLEKKPIFTCIMGGDEANETRRKFRDAGIACYDFPETAVKAASSMLRQSLWKDSPLPVEVGYRRDMGRARKVIDSALADGITDLAEYRAMELVRAYEMPVLEAKLARTSAEAVNAAKQIGYPVALKIASPHITHKSEAGGISLDITSPDMLRKEFVSITESVSKYRKNAYVAGCLVQAMAPKNAYEVIVSFQRDEHFGPMVCFSLGGIYRDTFQDVSCRLAPLSLTDAYDMIREIKFFPLLASKGSMPKLTALEDLLLIMSELAVDFPEIQEAECDPVFINEQGAFMGGMRVYLKRK